MKKISKDIDTNVANKTVVKDLYKSSLNQKKYDELKLLIDAVSETKNLLNNQYCSGNATLLSDEDIINVLYYADSSFRTAIDSLTIIAEKKPEYGDMTGSCLKFSRCMFKNITKSTNYLTGDYGCTKKIPSAFEKIKEDKNMLSTFTDNLEGTEYFWNGSLDDSKFDLLIDVYDIAKLLFGKNEVQEPPKIVFFDMPTMDSINGVYQSPNYKTVINWFSPENSVINPQIGQRGSGINNLGLNRGSGSSINSNLGQSFLGKGDSQKEENNLKKDNFVSLNQGDEDIENFITTVNSSEYETDNAATISMGNSCVSGFSYQYSSTYTVTETGITYINGGGQIIITGNVSQQSPQEYLDRVLQQIHSLQCNNDFNCDSWESSTCPDCLGTFSGVSISDEISNMLNDLEFDDGEEISEQTMFCIDNCVNTQLKLESQLLCVAKCFCIDTGAKLSGADKIGVASNFRLKFCIVPAVGQESPGGTSVNNINDLFTIMNELILDLKNNGSTLSTVKTKSFFDSSYSENNFAKQLSFSVVSEQRNRVSEKSQKAKENVEKTFNENLASDVLGVSKDPNLVSEKNKYIVAQEYVADIKSNVEDFEHKQEIVESKKNEIILIVDSDFDKFMQINSEFWRDVKSVLNMFNEQANNLKSKG